MDDATPFARAWAPAKKNTSGHVCDEVCESGDEIAERTFTHHGISTTVTGPRAEVGAQLTWTILYPDPAIRTWNAFLPTRPGRAAVEEIRARAVAENPGREIVVSCTSTVTVVPAGVR